MAGDDEEMQRFVPISGIELAEKIKKGTCGLLLSTSIATAQSGKPPPQPNVSSICRGNFVMSLICVKRPPGNKNGLPGKRDLVPDNRDVKVTVWRTG